ncbi:hypothetical protein GQX74_014888 [Glossina fuscipes]|nr:hypothetical protein GQX74_014888 [Glossina fuscipes]
MTVKYVNVNLLYGKGEMLKIVQSQYENSMMTITAVVLESICVCPDFDRSNTTEEYPTDSSAAEFFNSLSRKLNDLFRMSDNESLDNARNTSGNIAGNGSGGHSQQDPPARPFILTITTEELQKERPSDGISLFHSLLFFVKNNSKTK